MDLISRLPEPVLHDILRRLSAEDCAQTCVLSKTWRQTQSSCPFMNFQLPLIVIQGKYIVFHGERRFYESFMDSIQNSLDRFFSNPNSGHLLEFRLKLSFLYDSEKSFRRLDLWLNRAIKNGMRHLDLQFLRVNEFIYNLPSSVLHSVSETLTRLRLSDCKLDIRYAGGVIKFPNLEQLSLQGIDLSNDSIKRLISGCPLLEHLKILYCYGFTALNVTSASLPRLESFELLFCSELSYVELESPNFQSFRYGNKMGRFCKLNLACSHNTILRRLILEYASIKRAWLEQQSLRCKELVIYRVHGLQHINISSQKLTKLTIKACRMSRAAEIDCPNLCSLVYTQNKFPFHSTNNSKLGDIRLQFLLHDAWLDKLKDFFENFSPKRDLIKIGISFGEDEDVLALDGLYESMFPVLHDIKHMKPTVTICSVSNSLELDNFLNDLFSCSSDFRYKVLKVASTSTFCNRNTVPSFIFDKLSRIKQERCCCRRIYNCWRCNLFDVKQDFNTSNNIHDAFRSCKFDPKQTIRLLLEWRTLRLFELKA